MTTDKRIVPIKKDPVTKMTKEEIQRATVAFMKTRNEQRFKPMWMRNIPMTYEDFKYKDETWLSFRYALKNTGLDYDKVKKRLREG